MWLGPDNTVWGVGYSGHGDSKNNPADEGLRDKGPCPSGNFKIVGPPLNSPKLGPGVLHLIPDELTRQSIINMGRDPDSLYLHGDGIKDPGEASDGCIVQNHPVRERIWSVNATDADLTVVAI